MGLCVGWGVGVCVCVRVCVCVCGVCVRVGYLDPSRTQLLEFQ